MVDLRKAKPGDIYVDGRGNNVRILCTDRNDANGKYNVVALRETVVGEEIMSYTLDGVWVYGQPSCYDNMLKKFDLVKRIEVVNDEEKLSAQQYLISKGYPVNTGGEIPTYEELYEIIKDGIIDAIKMNKP